MATKIDHLVIGAANLKQGVEYVRDMLGVDILFGGVHTSMGTHNHLMQLGDDLFLEVISVNDEIPQPSNPRWYGLDDPFIRSNIEIEPTLLTWVINTPDLGALINNANFSLGRSSLISRGELSWYFSLPDDGRLLGGGMLPYAIQWLADVHPSQTMKNVGCTLHSLEVYHSHSYWLKERLSSVVALELVKIHDLQEDQTSYLVAYIDTPTGIKKLYSSY
jgi:hypothetical protein